MTTMIRLVRSLHGTLDRLGAWLPQLALRALVGHPARWWFGRRSRP
jgi:hypothetical protein